MQEIDVKYNLDLDEFFQRMDAVSNRLGTVEASLTGLKNKNPFVQANQTAQQLNTTLSTQGQIYQKIQATAEAFRQEQTRLKQLYAELKAKQTEFIAAGRYGELTEQLDLVKARLAELKKGFPEITDQVEKLGKAGKGGAGGGIKGMVAELSTAISVSFGVAEGLKLMVTESAKFGKGLSQLSALTGVAGKDLQFLADAAVDLENKTGIAASDIVEGFKLVGGIKPELLESKEALASVTEEVVALAQASGESLQDSATAAVGALNQFGEGADQAGRFVNVLAAGAKVGASEVRDTAEALKSSGTAMKAAGLSFEQGNALIQSLAGVMIKGSEAGTALRNVILKLETDADKNLRPSIVGLDKALENAAAKYDTTTELTKVFGQENIVAARRILDTRGEIQKLTKDLTGTQTAYEQQRINLDNLSTDLDKLGTGFKGFFRDLGQSQDGFLRFAIQSFTSFLSKLNSKTGEYRAFFSSLLSGEGVLGATVAYSQKVAVNEAVKRRADQNKTVKETAVKDVTGSIDARSQALLNSGISKDNAAIQAAQEEFDRRQADLNRVRKQYNDTATALRSAVGEEKKQLIQDGKLDALALKQAKENATVASAALARAKKDKETRAAALKSALNEPVTKKTGKSDEQKAAEDQYRLLISAQEDYLKEYQKLETDFSKDRLEALKKDEVAYINEKAKFDQKELQMERDAFERKLQIAASNKTQVINGRRLIIPDTTVTLANTLPDFAKSFDERQKQIEDKRMRDEKVARIRQEYELLELAKKSDENELALFDKFWEEKLAKEDANSEKYNRLVQKRNRDRNTLVIDQLLTQTKDQESASLAFIDSNRFDQNLRADDPSLNALDIERKREEKRLEIRIEAGEKTLAFLKEQGEKENAVLIAQTQAAVDTLKRQQDELRLNTPKYTDVFDLLGLTDGMNQSELSAFQKGIQQIGDSIQQVTSLIIDQSNQRLQAIDNEIQAKEEQVRIEQERDKEGFANNLAARQAELDDLKRKKAEELQIKRNAVRVQQGLDAATQLSNTAVAVSNGIAFLTRLASEEIKLGPIAGPIAFFGTLAAMLASIFAATTKLRALAQPVQLRKGGRIGLNGRTHEQGGHRIEGTDIEVERSEWVVNGNSSDRFNATLDAINQNDPRKAYLALLQEGGIGLPSSIVNHMQQPGFGRQNQFNTKQLEDKIDALTEEIRHIKKNTRPRKQVTGLGDGRVLEIDEGKETIRTIKK